MKPRPRTASASLSLPAVLAAGGLAGSGDDDAEPSTDGAQEVSTQQVRLRLPEGWESLDAQEALAEADGEDGTLASIAERLGVPPAQLEATLQNADLVVSSLEEA